MSPGARRAWACFALVALGMLGAHALWARGMVAPAWVLGAVGGVLAGVAVLVTGRVCVVALACGAVAFGAAWYTARALEAQVDSLAFDLPPPELPVERVPMTIEGVVRTSPSAWRGAGGELAPFSRLTREGWSFELSARARTDVPSGQRVSGTARVLVPGRDEPRVAPGDVVRVTALWEPPEPPRNPGMSDMRLWSAVRGEVGAGVVSDASLVGVVGRARGVDRWRASLARAHEGLLNRAERVLPPETTTPMTRALLLGQREQDANPLMRAFARQGVAHMLAISGFHLAVLAGAALFVVRLTGDRGWVEPIAVALFVLVYMCVVPARPPIVRAGVMVIALLAGEAFGRRHDRLGVLAWVALGLALWRPTDLWTLGYQLSVGITAVLLWLGARTHARLFRRPFGPRYERPDAFERRWWFEGVQRLCAASVLCWGVSMAWIAHAAGVLAPLAPLTTVVVTPLVTLVMWLGAMALGVGMAVPAWGGWAAGAVDQLSGVVVGAVAWLDGLPGTSVRIAHLSLPLALAWTCGAVYLFANPGRRGLRRSLVLLASVACWTGVELAAAGVRAPDLRLDTFAVGDGTCHVLRSGGETLMWDCGSLAPGVGVYELPAAMGAVGIRRASTAVITHANFDHYSALPEVAERLGVERVLMHRMFLEDAGREGAAGYLLEHLEEHGIAVELVASGEVRSFGRCTVTFLGPPDARVLANVNDHSLVARIETPSGRRVLLTGDIQEAGIDALGAHDVQADLLELPHHGSATTFARGFLDRVDPMVVIQSTGPSRVGDPRWTLHRAGRAWFVTARDGWVWAEIERDGEVRAGSMRWNAGNERLVAR